LKNINFKQHLIILCLGLYLLLNILNLGNTSICFAKDHISLEVANIDSCCKSQNELCSIANSNFECLSKNNCDNCIDQKLRLGYSEQTRISLKTNVKNLIAYVPNLYSNHIKYNNRLLTCFQSRPSPHISNNLDKLNTVILLI
jgi:hypothetical protein